MTDPDARSRPLAAAGPWLGSLVLGLLVGAASLLGDAAGIRLVNGLANAAGPWLLVGFASGALHRLPRNGAIAGIATLVLGVLTYYMGIGLVWGPEHTYAGPLIAMWLGAAVVGGAVLGAAGSTWITATGARQAIAGALPVAVLFAEAAHRFVQIAPWESFDPSSTYAQVMLAEAIAGGVLAGLVIRNLGTERRTGCVATAGLTAVGLAAFLAVESLARVLAFL